MLMNENFLILIIFDAFDVVFDDIEEEPTDEEIMAEEGADI